MDVRKVLLDYFVTKFPRLDPAMPATAGRTLDGLITMTPDCNLSVGRSSSVQADPSPLSTLPIASTSATAPRGVLTALTVSADTDGTSANPSHLPTAPVDVSHSWDEVFDPCSTPIYTSLGSRMDTSSTTYQDLAPSSDKVLGLAENIPTITTAVLELPVSTAAASFISALGPRPGVATQSGSLDRSAEEMGQPTLPAADVESTELAPALTPPTAERFADVTVHQPTSLPISTNAAACLAPESTQALPVTNVAPSEQASASVASSDELLADVTFHQPATKSSTSLAVKSSQTLPAANAALSKQAPTFTPSTHKLLVDVTEHQPTLLPIPTGSPASPDVTEHQPISLPIPTGSPASPDVTEHQPTLLHILASKTRPVHPASRRLQMDPSLWHQTLSRSPRSLSARLALALMQLVQPRAPRGAR
jgi:hypothetical protein